MTGVKYLRLLQENIYKQGLQRLEKNSDIIVDQIFVIDKDITNSNYWNKGREMLSVRGK